MKSILYLALVNKDNPNEIGVVKKITNQKKTFESLGYSVKLSFFKQKFIFEGNKFLFNIEKLIYKVKEKFIFSVELVNEEFDILYIRKPIITRSFIRILKVAKERNKKVILEIPTYPYIKEKTGLLKKTIYLYEKQNLLKLEGLIDLITYFGEAESEIWGIPALKLENGIIVRDIPIRKNRGDKNKINFIAVANLSEWHGYDRFLSSIAKLSREERKRILFHIVGEGAVFNKLQDMVSSLKIKENVIFYGSKSGKSLNEIFDEADIGVGSLGMYRIGLNSGSTLKAREFSARGLPFIIGYQDDSFKEVSFVKNMANNDSTIDLKEIISWFEKSKFDSESIRKYAKNNLSWESQMKKVINKIEKNEE